MKEILQALGEDLATLNTLFLEYRIRLVTRPTRPEDPWRIGIFFSSAEQEWQAAEKIFVHTIPIAVGVHCDKREAAKQAIYRMLEWCKQRRNAPRSELNPPFTIITNTRASASFQRWSDIVPWYLDWRKSFHRNLQIEIDAYRTGETDDGPWGVCLTLRNKLGHQKNMWHGEGANLVEAFQRAGQQVLHRFQEIQRIGTTGAILGPMRERRLHTLLNTTKERLPSWIQSARLATPAEDRVGIDLIVESDVGEIHLQVKSSDRGKEAFAQRPGCAYIACIIVHEQLSDEEILQTTVNAMSELRELFLRRKR